MVDTKELKKAMLDAGVNQRQLSERSGISINALNRKINNRAVFTIPEVSKICECLGITTPHDKCKIFLPECPRTGTKERKIG